MKIENWTFRMEGFAPLPCQAPCTMYSVLWENGKIPVLLTFSFAALLAFYSGGELRDGKWMGQHKGESYQILDDQPVLEFFKENAGVSAQELTTLAAARTDFWGEDLSGYPEFAAKAGSHLHMIREQGMEAAMKAVLAEGKV